MSSGIGIPFVCGGNAALTESDCPADGCADDGHGMNALTPTAVFKALADETRARIALLVMREQELCVCELTCALDESQPKISRHLAVLRQAGLLADRRRGQWVYYRLHPDLPDWVPSMLGTVFSANSVWLDGNAARLAAMGDRPARQASCC